MANLNPRSEFSSVLDASRWDWYQVTVKEQALDVLLPMITEAFPLADFQNMKGQHGYLHGLELVAGSKKLLHILYGGQSHTANITASSEESPILADLMRRWGGPFKPTRVDSCLDWEEPGLFDCLTASLLQFATEKEIRISQLGDWHRGKSRTLYIGSPRSPVQLRLYEKGYQVAGDDTKHPHWVRLEVQVRPDKQRRAAAAHWFPADAFAAGWVSEAVERFFLIPGIRIPVGKIRQASDTDRQRAYLLKQYGNILRAWAEECGTPEDFGSTLVRELNPVAS
jgi:hypothetical protein